MSIRVVPFLLIFLSLSKLVLKSDSLISATYNLAGVLFQFLDHLLLVMPPHPFLDPPPVQDSLRQFEIGTGQAKLRSQSYNQTINSKFEIPTVVVSVQDANYKVK